MQSKITLPGLSNILSQRTGLTKRLCEDFVRELFQLVSSELSAGENVKIKDIGTFRLSNVDARKSVDIATGEPIEIPGHKRVVFIPSKALAEAVNSPFEAFEPVEIPEGYSLEDTDSGKNEVANEDAPADSELIYTLDEQSTGEATSSFDSYVCEENQAEYSETSSPLGNPSGMEVTAEDGFAEENPIEEASEEEPAGETKSEPEIMEFDKEDASEPTPLSKTAPEVPSDVNNSNDMDEPGDEEYVPLRREVKSGRFGWGVFVGFASCLIIFGVIAVVGYNTLLQKIERISEPEIPKIETGTPAEKIKPSSQPKEEREAEINVATLPSDINTATKGEGASGTEESQDSKKVYDTITRTRYLTTMARDHYGNYNLWPYIYEENKSFLGHPDRIKPGTRVVVPPLSKYGVNPKSKADIEKARKMGVEIYARYGQ